MTTMTDEYTRAYYHKNREKMLLKMADYARRNRHVFNAAALRQRRKAKDEMVFAYGGACVCCGERLAEFLTIGHKTEGAGIIERRNLKSTDKSAKSGGYRFYLYLKKLGWPKEDYQLECYNCNCAKRFNNGCCPHTENSLDG